MKPNREMDLQIVGEFHLMIRSIRRLLVYPGIRCGHKDCPGREATYLTDHVRLCEGCINGIFYEKMDLAGGLFWGERDMDTLYPISLSDPPMRWFFLGMDEASRHTQMVSALSQDESRDTMKPGPTCYPRFKNGRTGKFLWPKYPYGDISHVRFP